MHSQRLPKFCQPSSPPETTALRLSPVLPRQQKENIPLRFTEKSLRLQSCKELMFPHLLKSKKVNSCPSSIMSPGQVQQVQERRGEEGNVFEIKGRHLPPFSCSVATEVYSAMIACTGSGSRLSWNLERTTEG